MERRPAADEDSEQTIVQDVDCAPAVGRGLPTPEDIGVVVGHVDGSEWKSIWGVEEQRIMMI